MIRSENDNWDYKGTRKQGVHNLGRYPATMVAEMQLRLLAEWTTGTDLLMLDPFMGSGTALVEAQQLGLRTIGIDINPYAVLLSQVKTHNYRAVQWGDLFKRLKLALDQVKVSLWSFKGIEKWFRPDIIQDLSVVRSAIMAETDIWVRRFLWVCMSETIYTHSNDRTSTFKLHVKPEEQIQRISDDVKSSFLKTVVMNSQFLQVEEIPKVKIYSGDSKRICRNIQDASVDVICTSPPYGENATTVTYGQASILFLKWIDARDLEASSEQLKNYSAIDSMSLGGKYANQDVYSSPRLEQFIASVAPSKRRKVRRFISDYWLVTRELGRITKPQGVALYTVGNRRIDGVQQPLDEITEDMYRSMGFSLQATYGRNILSKRIPKFVASVKAGNVVKSMDKERILVFRKEK